MAQRLKGYVVGCDTNQADRKICKVRVKDPSSPHDGAKFIVASVRNELELAQGLNVNFVLGTIDDPSGTPVFRAVDVCLELPNGN